MILHTNKMANDYEYSLVTLNCSGNSDDGADDNAESEYYSAFELKVSRYNYGWKDDNSATECSGCNTEFTFYRRRHHCRNCGDIYCHKCCSNWLSSTDLPKHKNIYNERYLRTCGCCMDRFGRFKQALFNGKLYEAQELVKTGLVYHTGVSDSLGVSPLHWAALGGDIVIVQWIEAAGEDITKSDRLGRSVLSYAVNGRRLALVKWLTFQRNMALSCVKDPENITLLLHEALREMLPVGAISNIRQSVECSICLDKSINCALMPCGHACSCLDCAATLENCPLCRVTIERSLKIY